jgi:hypothetical protein
MDVDLTNLPRPSAPDIRNTVSGNPALHLEKGKTLSLGLNLTPSCAQITRKSRLKAMDKFSQQKIPEIRASISCHINSSPSFHLIIYCLLGQKGFG